MMVSAEVSIRYSPSFLAVRRMGEELRAKNKKMWSAVKNKKLNFFSACSNDKASEAIAKSFGFNYPFKQEKYQALFAYLLCLPPQDLSACLHHFPHSLL